MTIYEALGIENILINMALPKSAILENIQNKNLINDAKYYFQVINSIILRASLHRSNDELEIIEVELDEPKYIDKISRLIQTAIKHHIIFVFSFDRRYIVLKRSFKIANITEHVSSQYLSYSTQWIYEEDLNDNVLELYHINGDVIDDEYRDTEEINTAFHRLFSDIFDNIREINNSIAGSSLMCLRQFCDLYSGHRVCKHQNLIDIVENIILSYGIKFVDNNIYFEKNAIDYTIANLQNTTYLHSLNKFGRHPFSYFDNVTFVDYYAVENEIYNSLNCNSSKKVQYSKNFHNILDESYVNYVRQISKYRLLTAKEEIELLTRMHNGDQSARELLIVSNLRLVMKIAKKYLNQGMSLDDLVQEGTFGLIRALENHDTSYNTRVSTYATYWIKQAISRAINNHSYIIRHPIHLSEKKSEITKVKNELLSVLGHEPSIYDIAKRLKIPIKNLINIIKISDNVTLYDNIDEVINENTINLTTENENISPFKYVATQERSKLLCDVLHTLTSREERIIKLRFGIYDGRARSWEEVGREFKLTRERIRQIEAKAMRKLRHPSRSKKLRDYIEIDNRYIGYHIPASDTPCFTQYKFNRNKIKI